MNKSEHGFTLVEVMIAGGLLAALAIGFTSLMSEMNKGNLKAQTDSEMLLTTNEMVTILSDPDNCLAVFSGKNAVNDATVTKLKYKTADKFPIGTSFGMNHIKISSYTLSDYNAATDSAILTVVFNKNKLLGPADTLRKINLFVKVDGANNVTSCRALAALTGSDTWMRSTTTPTDIYYTGGNVGIGTNTPAAALDVAGGIKAGSETQVTVCNVTTEGTQRYNKTSHSMEYCGASGSPLVYAWTSFGGASAGAEDICKTIEGYSWDIPTQKCIQQTMGDNTPTIVSFALIYNGGTSWSVLSSNVLYTKYFPGSPSSRNVKVVLESSTQVPAVGNAWYKFRIHHNNYYLDAKQVTKATLIQNFTNKETTMKVTLPDTDGNNLIEVEKSDDASGNGFLKGDVIKFTAEY